MTTFRRRRVNIMTNTPRFCINRRASVANNNQHTTAFLSKLHRCISRIQLSQAQRACSWSCTKSSNNFSTDFINFKNCPRHSLCVKFLLSIKRKIPLAMEGWNLKAKWSFVCFQAPPTDPALPEREVRDLCVREKEFLECRYRGRRQ